MRAEAATGTQIVNNSNAAVKADREYNVEKGRANRMHIHRRWRDVRGESKEEGRNNWVIYYLS